MFQIWLILEFLLFIKLISVYGFLVIFAIYTLPAFIGFLILAYYPKALISSLQNAMQRHEKPKSKALHSLFIIVSAFFFIIPSFTSRIIALFLFLPISRHLLVFVFMWQWLKFAGKLVAKMQKFNFNSSTKGFSIYTNFSSTRSSPLEPFDSYDEREVIDVTPKQVDKSQNNN